MTEDGQPERQARARRPRPHARTSCGQTSAGAPVGGTVTSLVAKRGASDRFVVYLDGVRAFEVAAAVVDEEAVRANARLTAEDVRRLVEKDVPYRAREMALKLIAVRDRSRHDIESRLLRAGFGEGPVAGVLSWLCDLGYVDDLRFARHYGTEKLRGGWGERRIAAELMRLGVERDLVKQALEEAESVVSGEGTGVSSVDRVVEAVRRRFGRDFAADPRGAARRLAGFLGRRGYDWETINLVTTRLQEETGTAGDIEPGREGLLP